MDTGSEQFWVNVVGFTTAGVCILAILVLSLRQKRMTGKWPQINGGSSGSGWFSWVWAAWFGLSTAVPGPMLRRFPLSVVVPGIDISLLIAFTALAGFSLAWAFRAEWSRQTGHWISFNLLLPAVTCLLVVRDFRALTSMAWVWILAGLLAVFLTPYLARLAYVEFYLNRVEQSKGKQIIVGRG